MPAVDDSGSLQPIMPAVAVPRAHPQHPSPTVDGLRLEGLSVKEAGYHGQVFGVDTPYVFAFTGWGEIVPLIYQAA